MGELQPFHRAIVGGGQRAFIFKGKHAGRAFSHAVRKGNPDSIVLADAFSGKGAPIAICYAGDAQAVIQLKCSKICVIQGGEFDFRAGCKMVGAGNNLCVNHIVFGLDPGLFSAQAGKYQRKKQAKIQASTSQGTSCNVHETSPELLAI